MIKYLIGLLLFSTSAFAQKVIDCNATAKHFTYVKGDKFEGVIVSKDFVLPYLPEVKAIDRFTPSVEDVEATEVLLANLLQQENAAHVNQGGSRGPVIHENLSKYARQYYGYINALGERIIYVSNLWAANYHTEQEKRWKTGVVVVLDGGSGYWQVKANLTAKMLMGLNVNGAG